MKISKRVRISILVGLSVITVLIIGVAIIATLPPGEKSLDINARLSELTGVVEARNNAQDQFNQVNDGFILKSTMQLQTKEQSKARLDLSTGTIVRLGQNTMFSLEASAADTVGVLSRIQLQAGRVWIVLKGGSLDVNTPAGLASVRGSYMSVWMKSSSNEIIVCCLEGSCTYQNAGGIVYLTTGQKIISSDTNVTPAAQPMDQADMQDWRNNSPESSTIVSQVSIFAVTSTPVSTPSAASTSTVIPKATPDLTTTPGLLITPYPTYYAGFDPALIQECLSYGYTLENIEKMITCLTNLSLTITPWIINP